MSVSRPPIRAASFEQTAGKIMYRWSVERDIWVSPTEVEEARAYLGRMGIPTTALPDGRFLLEGTEGTVEASRLILLSLRYLCARRPRLRA
jgi:hypothetical protein